MKKQLIILTSALALLLAGCRAEGPVGTTSVPQELSAGQSSPPEPSPEASAGPTAHRRQPRRLPGGHRGQAGDAAGDGGDGGAWA